VPFDGGELISLEGPEGSVVTGASIGEGDTAAVYLHQTAPSGFCGWVPYAGWAADQGVRGVLIDLCGWGKAQCKGAFASDPVAQVKLAVDWARGQGAKRVTVIGASLGGATALAAGSKAGADAVVDLSGPFSYQGLPTAAEATPSITVPLLVAMATNDLEMEPDKVRAAFNSAPSKQKRWVATESGHGWGMLNDGTDADPQWTPLAKTVLGWAKGDVSSAG
jgi:dienelactone hydrolase